MNIEKMKKWLEFTNQYQKNDFWKKIFDHQSPDQFFETEDKNIPIYDVYQNESQIYILIELPGVNKNDIHLSLKSNSHLLVKGNIRQWFPAQMEVKKERYYGEFERLIPLPEPTEARFIQVHYQHGLLHVTYPRQVKPLSVNDFS
jgi:HSP20 family protein